MNALNQKLLRDLLHLRGQAIAIILIRRLWHSQFGDDVECL